MSRTSSGSSRSAEGVRCRRRGKNAKRVYLGLTSRHLDEPVSLAVKGLTSSGKSYVIDVTLDFFPDDAYIELTAMSERALIYDKRDFQHKTLVLFEAVALREQREKTESNLTAYFVRSLLSEGRIRYPVTIKNKEGQFVTQVIEKNGPTNMILSTTATSLHGENETRMLSLPTNDSSEQTGLVLRQTALKRYGDEMAPDLGEWVRFQEWIAQANHKVAVPFAHDLSKVIPPVAVRLRRDWNAILGLSSLTRSFTNSRGSRTPGDASSPRRPTTSPCETSSST